MRVLFMIALLSSLCAAATAKPSYEIKLPVFPKSRPPANVLCHIDLMQASLEMRFAATVLQGIVNREEPRIYTSQDPGWHGTMNLQRWMDDLKRRGYTFEPASLEEALARFRASVKGAVLYEPGLDKEPESLHKLNAITLYCAINDCLPVTLDLNDTLKLPVRLDVRGKYNTAAEAYGWAYRELWPHANHGVLAHTCPTHVVLRDYLVQHKVMPIWIGKGTPQAGDAAAQRFLAEGAPNTPLLGCWGGYGESPPGRYSEPELQRISSGYGKYIVVVDGCFNLSVFSGIPYQRPQMTRRQAPSLDRSKVYVVFNVTDGDNLQYLQQYFVSGQWWLDPNRGKAPISWSLNPAAHELIPTVVEHLQSTVTANEEFVCSTAGIGLATPPLWGANLPVDQQALYTAYLRATNEEVKITGQSCIHLGDTSLVPWTRADFDRCAREMPAVKGILGDYGKTLGVFPDNATYSVSRGIPVFRTLTGMGPGKDDDERARQIADGVRAQVPSVRPAFMHVCLVNWFVTPTAIMKAAELLGKDYVPVLPSEMIEIYRTAHESR